MFSSIMFVSMGGVTIYPMFDVLNAINLNRGLYGLMVVKLFTVPIINIYLVKGIYSVAALRNRGRRRQLTAAALLPYSSEL